MDDNLLIVALARENQQLKEQLEQAQNMGAFWYQAWKKDHPSANEVAPQENTPATDYTVPAEMSTPEVSE